MLGVKTADAFITTVWPLKLVGEKGAFAPPLNEPKYCAFTDGQAELYKKSLMVE